MRAWERGHHKPALEFQTFSYLSVPIKVATVHNEIGWTDVWLKETCMMTMFQLVHFDVQANEVKHRPVEALLDIKFHSAKY